MASKLCDSCKAASATLFCRADAAFLCVGCDAQVHAANKLASRHARVWVCEVCEQAPAHVTCKADAAALCVTCDRDIHSANPLARRHERVPVTPIFDPPAAKSAVNFFFSDDGEEAEAEEASSEEAEAASWLLPNPKACAESPDLNSSGGPYGFPEMEPYLDLDYGAVDLKLKAHDQQISPCADGVVPVVGNAKNTFPGVHVQTPIANEQCYEIDFSAPSKPFVYGYNAHCLSHSVSSSSLDVGVVPEANAAAPAGDMSDFYGKPAESGADPARQAVPMSAADREARVLRYREKRKNRKFEKTIRYASRKAYAETRPRIKGRFAKRTEVDIEADRMSGYGVVPSF